jgi:pyruvate/2-oxoglutarate dehydrogenase complex dihydrolipoamide acyltransferase (E2) component
MGDEPRLRASPLARAIAREHGVDLRAVRGSGRAGRVLRADVLAHVEAGGPEPDTEPGTVDVAPRLALTVTADAARLLDMAGRLETGLGELVGRAAGAALRSHPDVAAVTGDGIPVLEVAVDRFMPPVSGGGAAVLAVGAVTRAVVEHEGAVAVRPRVQVVLTVDDRVPDAAAAGLLATLRDLIERPARFLV